MDWGGRRLLASMWVGQRLWVQATLRRIARVALVPAYRRLTR